MDSYTEQEFDKSILEFREMIGKKDFWDNEERIIERAPESLAYVYLYTRTDDADRLATKLQAIMQEYEMRKRYMLKKLI